MTDVDTLKGPSGSDSEWEKISRPDYSGSAGEADDHSDGDFPTSTANATRKTAAAARKPAATTAATKKKEGDDAEEEVPASRYSTRSKAKGQGTAAEMENAAQGLRKRSTRQVCL